MTLSDDVADAAAPKTDPPPHSWRPLVLRLHFYAGVLVAPFILIAALTGGLYDMATSIDDSSTDILTSPPDGPALPLTSCVGSAQAAFTDLATAGVRRAADPTDAPGLSCRSALSEVLSGRCSWTLHRRVSATRPSAGLSAVSLAGRYAPVPQSG
jgi:hypothetical protein